MEAYFSSGRAIDVILMLLVAEAVAVAWWLRGRGRYAGYVLALLPGLCLFLALRAALTGAGWIWVALWITLSLPAHVIDLAARVRR
jgi:hypothetical protein